MVGPSADLTTEWEGGSLAELIALLQTSAMPVRIEVFAPGTTSNAGEVHLLAGGLADAFAGSLRRDDAMAALQRIEGARFVIEARLPDPESGSLGTPGPREGSLKERTVAALMRYCEDYVLTCRLEVWRGPDRAAISYRRGEIISTMVGGADGSERLPEVMGWTEGSYEIVLPAPVLPQTPSRRGATRAIDPMGKAERKRHTTLPMTAGSGEFDPNLSGIAARPTSSPPAATARLNPPAQPAPAAKSPGAVTTPASTPAQPPSARPQAGAQTQARQGGPVGSPAAPVQPAHQPARPAASPATGTPATTGQPSRSKPASSPASADVPAPGQAAGAKGNGSSVTASMGSVAARAPAEPLPPEMTARGTPPVPEVPLIPARPAAHATPAATTAGKAPAAEQRTGKPEGTAAVAPGPAPFQLAQPGPARPGKQAPASNDLKPASGTIEAKSRHSNHLPPVAAPIEIADQPSAVSDEQAQPPVNEVMGANRPTTSRRARVARKGLGEHSVKVYVLIGLAIGAGIVVTYWAYWYLPFFHH